LRSSRHTFICLRGSVGGELVVVSRTFRTGSLIVTITSTAYGEFVFHPTKSQLVG
jgi:hypothetical protein